MERLGVITLFASFFIFKNEEIKIRIYGGFIMKQPVLLERLILVTGEFKRHINNVEKMS